MSTLTIMKARIASELARTDLTTQIAEAISTAIQVYQKERFRFSDTIPGVIANFFTVANQWIYTSADLAAIGSLMKIDYVGIVNPTILPLDQETPEFIRMTNASRTNLGVPQWWAYEGNSLLLAPVPTEAWVIAIDAFRSVPAPASDGETDNPWMVDAELLIRSRAKFEIATHVTRNTQMADDMSPAPPPAGKSTGHAAYRAWKMLKGEGNRVTARGRVRAMAF